MLATNFAPLPTTVAGAFHATSSKNTRVHGFISASGGTWYTHTLKARFPGDRVWVKIPGNGYVGVGRVTESVQPLSALKTDDRLRERAADP